MKQRSSIFNMMLVVLMGGSALAGTIYVTPTGTDGAGTSWAVSSSLANALSICTAADEIWVAEGTYTDSVTFTVNADCTLYGGFTNGMATRGERDWDAYPAILDGQAAARRVVTVSGADVILDGLVISNAYGAAAGGIRKAVAGQLTLANCRIVDHEGSASGVGGYFSSGSVLMTNCLVARNEETGYYIDGWGIYASGVDLDVVDCVFSNNSKAGYRGSSGLGLYFNNGTLRALRTDFIDNVGPANGAGPTTVDGGAGVYLGNSASTDATFRNCVFRGNEATISNGGSPGYGVAMCMDLNAAATARVVNCTFVDNSNLKGNSGAIYLKGGTLAMKNSILWSNTVASGYIGSEIYNDGGTLDISYCDLTGTEFPHVVGATIPLSCRARTPLFVSATDLHLQSPAGRWDLGAGSFVTTDGNYSPCIDGGDPADGIGAEPTDNANSRINMGRYGGTAQASKSPSAAAPLLEDLGYSVHYHRAEITGEVTNATFVSAHVYLCYGTSSIPGDTTNGWDEVTYMGEKQIGAEFSTWTPALAPTTTHYYRWYAANDQGSNWTAAASFDTGAAPASGGANVIHVDCLATGAGDGTDWGHAYPSLVTAAMALEGTRTNVWITADTYTEGLSVELSASAAVVGGFAGTETAPSQRTGTNALGVVTNYTVIDGEGFHQCFAVTAGDVSMESVVFTNGSQGIAKGGVGTLMMSNCKLVGNAGYVHGVGGNFGGGGSVLMTNCVVAGNAETSWYRDGWGIYSYNNDLVLTDCVISNNSLSSFRDSAGLGLYFDRGTLLAVRTDIVDNEGPANTASGGAGVYLGSYATTEATFSNCVFRGNVAKYCGSGTPGVGGAMWVNLPAAGVARVVNCTFTDNANLYGDGGAIYLSGGTLVLKNSILWSNVVDASYTGSEIYKAGGTLDISYCDLTGLSSPHVVGATPPGTCLAQDPSFASETDLHIASKAGRWDPAVGGFVTTDAAYSYCIDAGDPADSIGDEPTDNGNTRINMGRYGGTAEASKSPQTIPPLLADRGYTVNGDHAHISGEITNATFVSAEVYFCYGTSSIPGDTTNGWDTVAGVGTKQNGVVFSTWTPKLLPVTTYHYRWYAVNNDGSNWTAAASFATGTAGAGGGADVIHVNRDATGAGDGSDWVHAYTQVGVGFAAVGGSRTNVWITGGTYAEGGTVTLPQGAALIGGFAGTETAVAGRAGTNALGVVTNYTVISGEDSHPCMSIAAGDVLMESIELSNGLSTQPGCGLNKGGSGDLTLVNCRLVDNRGSGHGSGGYFVGGSVLMTNCLVAGNAQTSWYTDGWGIYSSGADLDLVGCVVSNNSSTSWRGSLGLGLYFNNGTLRAWRTDFIDNSGPATSAGVVTTPTEGGAGVCLWNSANTSATFSNCVFRGNQARYGGSGSEGVGGAIWVNMAAAATARVVNCTFTDNANLFGNGGAIALRSGTLILKNSILWSNDVAVSYTGSELYQDGGTLIADYCDLTGLASPYVVGAVTLTSCISTNPLFASATDVHLQSKGGRWSPATAAWVEDAFSSPCIDAGDPADSVGQEPHRNGDIVNLGAYGATAEASITWIKLGSVFRVR